LQARLKDTALFARVGDSVPLKLFSVEVDPLRAFCYLHGFVERHNGDNETERFVPFLAGEPTPR
jgi:hypothetical protein